MRDHGGKFTFAPRLPSALTRLTFRLFIRGRRLLVEMTHKEATYSFAEGEPLEIYHHGDKLVVRPGQPEKRPIPPIEATERPTQPPGREPEPRRPQR